MNATTPSIAAARRAAADALHRAHQLADELASLVSLEEINDALARVEDEAARLKDRLRLLESVLAAHVGGAAQALEDFADRLGSDLAAPAPPPAPEPAAGPCPFEAPPEPSPFEAPAINADERDRLYNGGAGLAYANGHAAAPEPAEEDGLALHAAPGLDADDCKEIAAAEAEAVATRAAIAAARRPARKRKR